MLNEDRATVLELLRAAGEVCDHPILRTIVNEAPSPSAADKHIKDLGWGCDLARQVRMAVRAKQKVQDGGASKLEWEELFATTARSADAMFRFEYFTPPLSNTHFTTMNHKHSTAVRFGGVEAPCDNWPFFLREFWLQDDESYITTVDFRGSGRLFSCCTASGLDAALWHWGGSKQPLLYARGESGGGSDFSVRITDANQALFYLYWLPCSNIHSQIKQMNVPGEPFPRFYKAVQVERDYGRPFFEGGSEHERIRVLFRIDTHPTNKSLVSSGPGARGEVWYERFIPVSRIAHAVLRLKWVITQELELGFDRPEWEKAHLRYLGVEYARDWHGPNVWQGLEDSTKLVKAMAALHADLAKILKRAYASRPLISLESIAGFSLVTNPPERLVDLFC